MSDKGKSTAQKKLEAVEKLKAWAQEKVESGTLDQYIRQGKLNRSEIARECGFARSTLSSSNDLLRDELKKIEDEFIAFGVLQKHSDHGERRADSSALESKLASKERELNSLRERLAVKTAENEELKRKLASSNSILDDIIPQGRRVQM